MRAGILTFNDTLNFGAALQAYALQETIKSFGYDVEIIKYTNSFIEKNEKNHLKLSPYSVVRAIIMGRGLKQKEKAFKLYETKNLKYGMILENQNIESVNSYYDKFITGSDQVWNMGITDNDWTFFLDFVKDSSKIISYAPSFGNDPFPNTCYKKASEMLHRFSAISVRETSGRELIKKISNLDSKVVVDPTLLLSKEQWETMCTFIPPIKKYILVYIPHNKKIVFEFVNKLSKKTGLPVVYLSISPRIQLGVKTIYDASPDEFVGWIRNASYVVTGSFHGTAFSINLEKQFYYESTGEGSRIDNLVKLTGTEKRCISENDANDIDDVIDYSTVRKKVMLEREDSREWLQAALKYKE